MVYSFVSVFISINLNFNKQLLPGISSGYFTEKEAIMLSKIVCIQSVCGISYSTFYKILYFINPIFNLSDWLEL